MSVVNIKATHTTLTQSMSDYVAKKMQPLQKFLEEENNVHVELEAEPLHHTGPRFRAEITILPRPGVFADAWGNNLYEAIDLCMPKIREQLLKRKAKTVSKIRRQQRRKRM